MKSLRLYIIILSALLVIYLVVQFNRPKAIDWSATFSSADKIPFGTYIAYNRLNDIFPDARIESFREPVYNVLNDHGITRGAYIIICDEPTLNEYDYQKLLDFIKAGNDVFIAAEAFGDEIEKRLKIEMGHEFPDFKSTVGLKFTSKHLDTNKIYQISRSIGLNYFRRFNHDTAVVLGMSAKHHPNFLKYPLGKGNLYLNADPLMFTNFGLLQKTGSDYAATALSYINPVNYVIWDQYYAIGREGDDSSIRVFLRSAALRWAFYSAFFGLVVFVLYDIKRRQRIIPVIEPLRNDTLTFVSTVGQVYYEEHNNMNLASKKILYFLEYLRDKYNLKTTTLNKEFTDGLAQKTGIDKEFAANLVNYINYLAGQQTNVTNDELIELNRFIEQFYIKSR
jgi:hypothetical protein